MKVEEYDELVRQRLELTLEVARTEREHGVHDPRYLEAVDAYNIICFYVDSLRPMARKGGFS